MNFRPLVVRNATVDDVAAMHRIRIAVRENQLSDDAAVTLHSYLPFIARKSVWVATTDNEILGFAALDASAANVWALFVAPGAQGQGVGRALHEHMLRWASDHGLALLWLTTGRSTRAEKFYRRSGWTESSETQNAEIRFERKL